MPINCLKNFYLVSALNDLMNKFLRKILNTKQITNSSDLAMIHNLPSTHYVSAGSANWLDATYHNLSTKGYQHNPITHRCIKEISQSIANLELILSENVEDLFIRPTPLQSCSSFLENIASQLLISGNAFIEAVYDDADEIVELWVQRSDRMGIVPSKEGLPKQFVLKNTGGHTVRSWQCDRSTGISSILHIKYYNPNDDWYGLSPLHAAMRAIQQYNDATSWNQALLQNGCRPSGALTVDHNLTATQARKLKSDLEDYYAGVNKAGKPMVLEGGMKWTNMMLSPQDMDYLNIKHSAAREIALCIGYPPMLLGIPGDNTYSNQKEARLALWEQTILPLANNIFDSMEHWLGGLLLENINIDYNKDAITALSPRRQQQWRQVSAANFLSDDEKKNILGL
jgi:HK97 family phage portal protein